MEEKITYEEMEEISKALRILVEKRKRTHKKIDHLSKILKICKNDKNE